MPPPELEQLTEEGITLPNEVGVLLTTLLSHPEEPRSSNVQRLIHSLGQDMAFRSDLRPKEAPKTQINFLRFYDFDK